MDTNRRRMLAAALALAAAPVVRGAASPWPIRPVRLVVPGGTGGVTDVRARWLAPRLGAVLGQPVVVENKAGAGGIVAMESLARGEADTHVIAVVHQGTMAVNPAMHAKLPYDALRDFAPLCLLGIGPLALVVRPQLEVASLADLLRLARSRAQPLTFGSPGVGTPPHLAGELFRRESGIAALHVPYRGGGQAATDLMAGHVDFSVEGLSVTAPLVKSGRLRALATTGPERVAALPDVPTMREAGLPNYTFRGWVGLAMQAATPRDIVARAHGAIAQVLATPEAIEWFAAAGAVPGQLSPDAFAAFVLEEQQSIGRIVREAGLRAE